MRRYLIASILIGLLSLGTVILLQYAGIYGVLGNWLTRSYSDADFFTQLQAGQGVVRWFWMEWIALLMVAFGVAWCMIDVSQIGQKILVYFTTLIVVSGLSPTLALYGVIFSPFPVITAATVSILIGFAYAGTEKGMRKRVLESVLGERVSKETLRMLVNSEDAVSLKEGAYEATVLTCRLFNHSELKEKMEAADLVAMTNRFLHNTADFLMSRGAYLDQSSPDCVRVFFGLLGPSEDHARQACEAALELKQRLLNLDAECESQWFHKPEHGVAISSGQMTVGVYGTPRHYYFSGVGLATDFSRRISAMNRIYGSDVLVSARTYQLAGDSIIVRPMEMVVEPESQVMTEVYELMASSDGFSEKALQCRDAFWEGMILYRERNYEKALEKFSQAGISENGKEDLPVKFFVSLAQERITRIGLESGASDSHQINQGHARLLNTL
ncbi:MAG: adenylate/guanylate cyclase domain-containing protein [Verrucomicrobia bacterium]|nr:adenylate/guanylate cyclase domain-containing protein [Verrucomicrobiota bacterium]